MPPTTPPAADLDPARASTRAAPDVRSVPAAHWVLDDNTGADEPIAYRLAEPTTELS